MEQSLITAVVLPLALAVIMFGMGLSLTVADFQRVIVYPKAMFLGLGNQLILLPMIGFLVAMGFAMSPELAVGILLIALCPGGPTSNIISFLARADLALSVSLTAVSSVITNITIPILLNVALLVFMGDTQEIRLPLGKTIVQIFVVTLFPVLLGMAVRKGFTAFAERSMRTVNIVSTVFFALILLAAIMQEREHIIPYFQQSGIAVILLNLAALGLGYMSGSWLALGYRQRVAISIETGIQNGSLAIVLALSPMVLNNPAMAVPAVIYSLTMFVTAAVVVVMARRRDVRA